MRYHDHCLAFCSQAREQLQDRVRCLRIEITGRFIGDQDRRIIGKRARNGCTLLLASGQVCRKLVRLLGNVNFRQQCHGPFTTLPHRMHITEIHRQDDILCDGQCGQKLKELENDADILAAPNGQLLLVESMDECGCNENLT